MKYVRLVERMRRGKISQGSRAELQSAIFKIQTELDEAWRRLAAHQRLHAFGLEPATLRKCQYCGANPLSDGGQSICEHCAKDLAVGRKPPRRETLQLNTKATAAE